MSNTHYWVNLVVDTSRDSKSRGAVSIHVEITDAAPTGFLRRQSGPVVNNSVSYDGVFASGQEAVEAIARHTGRSIFLWRRSGEQNNDLVVTQYKRPPFASGPIAFVSKARAAELHENRFTDEQAAMYSADRAHV